MSRPNVKLTFRFAELALNHHLVLILLIASLATLLQSTLTTENN